MNTLKYYGKDEKKREAWKAVYGPIPDKHCLIYLDSNPENKALENLACVSYSVMRVMADQKLFSTNPETTRAGIAVAEHRSSILKLIDKAIEETKSALPERPKVTIACKNCLKIKCKYWQFSLRKKSPPTCTRYNIPITEITKMLKSDRRRLRDWRKTHGKISPLSRETYLKTGGKHENT